MELLDQYAGRLNLKRKRNAGEASPTLKAKCPDLCLLVRNALLFKGKHKHQEAKLDQAVAELKQKMRRWSSSYHGKVSLSLSHGCMIVAMTAPCKGSITDVDHACILLGMVIYHASKSLP